MTDFPFFGFSLFTKAFIFSVYFFSVVYTLHLPAIRDIGEAINSVTKAAKCQIVTTYCGHGIGELFHTSPNVPHYPKNKVGTCVLYKFIFYVLFLHNV